LRTLRCASEILDALGQTSPPLMNYGDEPAGLDAVGCVTWPNFNYRIRFTSPATTAGSSHIDVRRACGCW
jgi:hypothetical protein